MEIRQIRYALCVGRHRNFSKAAQELYVTQQTLSQQIRRLEDEIGFELFERSTRTVSITPKGRSFLEKAEGLITVYDSFERDVESLRDEANQTIKLGILPTFPHLSILEKIYDFQAQKKGVTVQTHIQKSSRLSDMIEHGSLDAAIGNLSSQQLSMMKDTHCIHIFSRDYICAVMHCQHSLARNTEIRLSDIQGKTVLMLEKGSSIRSRLEAMFEELGIKPDRVIECPEIYSMTGMAQSEFGIGFLSSRVASETIKAPLISLPLKPEMEMVTAFYYQKNCDKASILNELSEILRGNN